MAKTNKRKRKTQRFPKRYTSGLSRKDKAKQLRELKRAKRSYKRGEYVHVEIKSFKS